MNPNILLSKIGISASLTLDVYLFIFMALTAFIYGMLLGKHKLMTVLVNIYVSFGITATLPKDLTSDYTIKVLVFLIVLVALTLMSRKFFDISFSGAGSAFLWKVFVVSFLQIGLILSIIFSIMPKKEALNYVSPDAFSYFTAGWAPLIWMILPLGFMFFLYRRNK